jgi:hypothetical protein
MTDFIALSYTRKDAKMALRVDLDRTYLIKALENAIASLKRSEGKGLNPAMIQLIQHDIALYRRAIDTLTDIKDK